MSCRLTRIFSKCVLRAVLILITASLSTSAFASTNSGIDTPTGVTTLPLAVQGVEGVDLVAQPDGAVYVGIGTTSPSQLLEVKGGAIIASGFGNRASGTGPALEIGYDSVETVLQSYDRTAGSYIPAQFDASKFEFLQGNVGIGMTSPQAALDVNGEIRPHESGAGCSSNNTGALRYDPGSDKMQYCSDSNGWTSLLSNTIGTVVGWCTVNGSSGSSNISFSGVTACYGSQPPTFSGNLGLPGSIACPSGTAIHITMGDDARFVGSSTNRFNVLCMTN